MVVLAVLVVLGFLGLDRWFYESFCLRFNTATPFDNDPYHSTKFFWNIARFWPHIAGGACCYVIIFVFARRGRRRANAALIAVLMTALLAHALQCGISRARPNQSDSALTFRGAFEGGFKAKGVGMPSGEAATAAALSLVVGFAFPRRRYIAWAPTVLVVLARVLPGMHYISDVAAGCLLAILLTPPLYQFALRPPSRLTFLDRARSRRRSARSSNQPIG